MLKAYKQTKPVALRYGLSSTSIPGHFLVCLVDEHGQDITGCFLLAINTHIEPAFYPAKVQRTGTTIEEEADTGYLTLENDMGTHYVKIVNHKGNNIECGYLVTINRTYFSLCGAINNHYGLDLNKYDKLQEEK